MIYNAHLFLIVFLTMLPAIVILSWLTKKRLDTIKKTIEVVVEQSLQYLNEALKGFVESNIYHKNAFFINRHKEAQKKVGSYVIKIQTTQDMPARFFEVCAILGLFVLIVAIKYTTTAANTDVIIIGAFIAAAYKIIPGISRIINLTGQVRTYQYAIEGSSFTSRQTAKASAEKIETIEFRDIHFSYKELKVLDGLNCSMAAGSFIGISGDSGSGKTTLLQLLLGFCSPHSGTVLFNGVVADDNTRIANWRRVAYVKQEPFILHDTILNNIVLFENEYDSTRLTKVLEITGLKEMTDRFPEGIYKPVMEAGKNLSGGQRKRIAIARALYKNADMILLDEPFSELDELSELKMLKYLKQLAIDGKLIILISHAQHSFQLCDAVIHVDQQEA
jgi:ABC-type bacteriocin/lantibiotic exporter with double-glycine peptidase domain